MGMQCFIGGGGGGGVVLDFPTLASSAILQAGITFLTLVALVPGSEILHLLI